MRRSVFCVLAILLASTFATAAPDPTPDPNAPVVFLRTDCSVQGTPLENCFEDMDVLSDPATGWIWTVRSPSAASPLLVDVGPGQFSGFQCVGGSHVSLRGSGREVSILKDEFGVDVHSCDDLVFLDLGIHGERYGVNWLGGGSASWSSVDMLTTGESTSFAAVGWNDGSCSPGEQSLHYIHGSRVRNTGIANVITAAFFSTCAETWFFGGEILLDVVGGSTNYAHGIHLRTTADFRAFGTAIRARVRPTGAVNTGLLVGVDAGGAQFHAHGAIINTSVDPAVPTTDATGLTASGDGVAHTPGTAFVVNASGGGVPTRVEKVTGTVKVLSPFLWQSGSTPPTAPGETNTLASMTGQDIFVETDCDASGNCSGAGNETHLMVYNSAACGSANPWFDTVTGACRP